MSGDADSDLAVRLACQDLVVRFTHHLDHGEIEAAFALFAEDGVWTRSGEEFPGRAAILANWKGRRPGDLVRHFTSNIMIDRDGPTTARGTSYFLCYIQTGEDVPPRLPMALDMPFSAGEWHDRFVLTDAGWRFTRRDTLRLYENAFYGRGVRYGMAMAARS